MNGSERVAAMAGFTLVELLCAIAVVTILIAGGLPNFRPLIASRGIAANVDAFAASLRFARSEAAKRAVPITVCIAAAADRPEAGCAATATNGWQSGWVVFVDRGEIAQLDEGDEILRVQQPAGLAGSIQSSRRYLTFQPTGVALNGTGSYLFRADGDSSDRLSRTICVSKQGRPRVVAGAGGCA